MFRGSVALFLLFVSSASLTVGHVTLDYPPPLSRLDFLDNIRTQTLCGTETSGADGSHLWRIPAVDNPTVITTNLEAGSLMNVTWNLHYPHQGGWRFQLLDRDGEAVAVWEDEGHWGCSYDGTQQWTQLRLPSRLCNDCVLRLERQALEWGESYLFRSCAHVRLVDANPCNGCSGNGACQQGKCQCYSNASDGFWEGTYCERQNECDEDVHCGVGGVCVDTGGTTPPRKQCYCRHGWFGNETQPWLPRSGLPVRKCDHRSNLLIDDFYEWEERYPHQMTSPSSIDFQLFYKVEGDVIEFAVKARTKGWIAIGMRPVSRTADSGVMLMEASSEPESEAEASSEGASESESQSEAESEPQSESNGVPLVCAEGPVWTSVDEGVLQNAIGESPPGTSRRLESVSVPMLQLEAQMKGSTPSSGGWIFEGRALQEESANAESEQVSELASYATSETEPEPEPVPESESESESQGEPGPAGSVSTSLRQPPLLLEAENILTSPSNALADGSCQMQFTADPSAHPMINQDIVIGLVYNSLVRVQDSYTPSRARPLPDAYFGGQDDILDAVGYEDGSYTYLKFNRPLLTPDSAADYCILPDVSYLMIYAFGQTPMSYSHVPPSSLEVKKASRLEFYGEDELKYHGGGIGTDHENRGSFGLVDFFKENGNRDTCDPSSLNGYVCMKEALGGIINLHWSVLDDYVQLAAETSMSGWIGVAWAETPGKMIGSTAVIGYVGHDKESNVSVYELTAKSEAGVIPAVNGFDVVNASVTETDAITTLEFSRYFDDVFRKEDLQNLLVASHGADALAYHGLNRAPIEMDLRAVPGSRIEHQPTTKQRVLSKRDKTQGSVPFAGCTDPDIDDLYCRTEVLPGLTLSWRKSPDSISLSVQSPGGGWVSVAWPERPGNMIPADAVIGSPSIGVGSYRLGGRRSEEIIPDPALMNLTDTQIEVTDEGTHLKFTRCSTPLVGSSHGTDACRMLDGKFVSEGDAHLLVAYHSESSDLVHHGFSNRAAAVINLDTGSASSVSVNSDRVHFIDAHALLMAVSWGILIPLGILVARTLKDKDPLWFNLHKALQVTGLTAAIAGFIIATVKFDTPDDFRHRQVGMGVMALGVLQPLNAIIRPHHGSLFRLPWQWLHLSVGRCAVVLAMYNIYTGLDVYEDMRQVGSKKWHFRFGIWLLALVLLYFLLEARSQGIRSREDKKAARAQQHDTITTPSAV